MAKEELEHQIRQLQRNIEKHNASIRSNNCKIEELEDIMTRLVKKADEMESSLENTLKLINNRLSEISNCEKFKTNYCERVKNILYNSSTNSAITETRQAITKIRKECYKIDSDNDVLYGKISYANKQINLLRERMEMEMMGNAEQRV